MNRRLVVSAANLVLLTSGCSATQNYADGSSLSASSNVAAQPSLSQDTPKTLEQLCAAQSWPRPVPQVTGLNFDDVWANGSLSCWPNVRGLAPDGHDVTEDKASVNFGQWTIAAVTPPPGTLLSMDATITANLVAVDVTQSVLWPCDWVTTDEIEAVTGITSVEATALDDYQGAVSPSCSYFGGSDLWIASTLRLPPNFAVDARAELELLKNDPFPGAPVTGLPAIDAYCSDDTGSPMLMAILSGGRGYQLFGGHGQTCQQLQEIAEIALGRIPK